MAKDRLIDLYVILLTNFIINTKKYGYVGVQNEIDRMYLFGVITKSESEYLSADLEKRFHLEQPHTFEEYVEMLESVVNNS